MKIPELIKNYALVYEEFEKLQATSALPGGDQKTGVIAEYYAKLYIESAFTNGKEIGYAPHGKEYDLLYFDGSEEVKVQVKAVSAHSKTRTISPIKLLNKDTKELNFHKLYLIALDNDFRPCGFWINDADKLAKKASGKKKWWLIDGALMQGEKPDETWVNGTVKYLDFNSNLIVELQKAIQ